MLRAVVPKYRKRSTLAIRHCLPCVLPILANTGGLFAEIGASSVLKTPNRWVYRAYADSRASMTLKPSRRAATPSLIVIADKFHQRLVPLSCMQACGKLQRVSRPQMMHPEQRNFPATNWIGRRNLVLGVCKRVQSVPGIPDLT